MTSTHYGELIIREKEYNLIFVKEAPVFSGLIELHENCISMRKEIRSLMIRILVRKRAVGLGMEESDMSIINLVKDLWGKDFNCALSIYMGYIILAGKWNSMLTEYRKSLRVNPSGELEKFWNQFLEDSHDILERIVDEPVINDTVRDIGDISVNTLLVAFHMLPNKTVCANKIPHVMDIINQVAKWIMSRDDSRSTEEYSFWRKYSEYILHLDLDEIDECLAPFMGIFSVYGKPAELFEAFVIVEDRCERPDNFWHVWEFFKDSVIDSSSNYGSEINIEAYLFARTQWKEDTRRWHTLPKEREVFFSELTNRLGDNTAYLFGLSKLLCGPGNIYLTDDAGIAWISSIITRYNPILSKEYREKVLFYLERIGGIYILPNRERIKRNPRLKSDIVTILNFLVKNESVVGYQLREDIV